MNIVGICSYLIDIKNNCICGCCNGKCVINNNYSNMVIKCNAVPIILPITTNKKILYEISKKINTLIICGHELYPRNGTIPDDNDDILMIEDIHDRDTFMVECMIKQNKKIIGICYGMQFLNSYFNGKIYLDIINQLKVNNHMKTRHKIIIKNNSKILKNLDNLIVNSYHNAGITKELLSNEFIISCISEDNIIEGIESKNHKIYGFQFHIEKELKLYNIIKNIIYNI